MRFTKMHGLGNDFMVVELIKQSYVFSSSIIKKLSNRNTGIGFDQLLIIEKSHNSQFDFHYRIFNSNGNEVEQCGNGARCVGLFVLLKNLTNKKHITFSTNKKYISVHFISYNNIQVNMNEPSFDLKNIPVSKKIISNNFSVKLLNKNLKCNLVTIGNPHCIIQVESIIHAPVKKIGQILERHPLFIQGINVGFMKIINKNHIQLRVYERDVGETQSCGSNACAAVAVGIAKKILNKNVRVDLLGGRLEINWNGFNYPLYMKGPANYVYDGHIYI
ncbi:Diaminopimelate epimerase [Buchnera aphidicola (Hyalopterus amygdali)]